MFTGDDLRKHIFPLPTKEPSAVLFELLGFMVSAGERLSSVTEILTGDQSNEAERPTTTMARIEQGLKVFSSIHKRLYRAFRQEYKKLFVLNRKYLDSRTYFRVLDDVQAVYQEDYDTESCDIVPVADPNESTNTQKLIRGQIWMSMLGQGFNDAEIRKRFTEGMQEPEPEKLLNAPEPPPPPDIILKQQELELKAAELQLKTMEFFDTSLERDAKIQKTMAQAIDALAKAESYEVGEQIDIYKSQLTAIVEEYKVRHANQQGGVGSVAGKSGNSGSTKNASGATG
jgi:hypothetical protein